MTCNMTSRSEEDGRKEEGLQEDEKKKIYFGSFYYVRLFVCMLAFMI